MCKCLISNGAVVTSNYLNGDCILNLVLDLKKRRRRCHGVSGRNTEVCNSLLN